MRRIILAFMSTVAVVVMLFGYRTSTSGSVTAAPTSVASGSGSSTTTAASPSTTTSGTTKTITGQAVQTRWGPVQVQISVTSEKVTAASVLQQPSSNGRDVEINNAALPVLKKETLTARNAKIDSVSGATYTSEGYISSLQSALDQAGL